MEDKRNLTMGLQFSVADAIDDLTNILGYIQKSRMQKKKGTVLGVPLKKPLEMREKGWKELGQKLETLRRCSEAYRTPVMRSKNRF